MHKSKLHQCYEIEMADEIQPLICKHCDGETIEVHGYVYKHSDAYGIYFAAWTPKHEQQVISVALGLGDWDEDSSLSDRTCFGLDIYSTADEFQFVFVDPQNSPWGENKLLGKMLTKAEAKANLLAPEVFEILEQVIANDEHIARFFEIEAGES